MQMNDPEDVAAQVGAADGATAEDQGDAAMMQLLAAAEEKHGLLDGGEPRADDGDEDADDEAFDDDESPEEQADEASTEGEAEDDAAADVQGLDEALKAALRRDGLPDGLIDQMVKADRDGALAYALQRKDNQREVSLAYQERAELKKQAEAQTGNGEEAEQSAQPEAANLDQLAQLLSDELSEETAGAVVRAFQQTSTQYQEQVRAAQAVNETLQAQVESLVLTSTRQGLRERFPQLADQEKFQSVVKRMHKLAPGYSGKDADLSALAEELMVDAARLEGLDDSASARTTRKRAGKGVTRPSRRTNAPPPTEDEAMWATFQRVERESGWQ